MEKKIEELIALSKDFGKKIAQIRVSEMLILDKKIEKLKKEILKKI